MRFLLELSLLSAVIVVVRDLTAGPWWSWPAALLSAVVVAGIWGLFVSPKAPVRLSRTGVLIVEAALFSGAAAGLFAVGRTVPAVVLLSLWLLQRIALALLR